MHRTCHPCSFRNNHLREHWPIPLSASAPLAGGIRPKALRISSPGATLNQWPLGGRRRTNMPHGWDIRGTCPLQFPRGTHWDGACYLQPHLLRNAPRICSFSSPRLVLLPKAISNPCQYYSSLPKLSVVLTTWKVFSKFQAPPPVSPSFSPNLSVLQTYLEPSFGELLPSLMLPPPFLFAYVHFRRAFKNYSNSTSSRKPSMSFPTPPCYHPSLACVSTYITYTNIRHFIMVALHCHHHLLTRQIWIQFGHFLAMWPRASSATVLSLSFLWSTIYQAVTLCITMCSSTGCTLHKPRGHYSHCTQWRLVALTQRISVEKYQR